MSDDGGGGDGDCTDACIEVMCSGCVLACCHAVGVRVLFRIVCALLVFAVLATAVTLLVIAFVARPAGVFVDNAVLGRLALADTSNATAAPIPAASLAYGVSVAVAVRNRNWLMHAEHVAPLHGELLFAGARFASVPLADEGSVIRPGHREIYHAAAAADSAGVPLGSAAVAEFVKETVAGVYQLELKVVGEIKYPPRHHVHRLSANCPLQLPLSTATSPPTFKRVKCAVFTT